MSLQLKRALQNGLDSREVECPTCQLWGGIFTHTTKKEIVAAGRGAQMTHLLPLLRSSFLFQEKPLWHENYHLYFQNHPILQAH